MPLIKGVHRYTHTQFWVRKCLVQKCEHTNCLPTHSAMFASAKSTFSSLPKKNFSKQPTASLTCSCLELLIVCPKPYVTYSPAQKASSLSRKSLKKHLGGYHHGLHVPECWLFSCQKYSAEHQMCILTTNWYKIVREMCVESGVQLFRS